MLAAMTPMYNTTAKRLKRRQIVSLGRFAREEFRFFCLNTLCHFNYSCACRFLAHPRLCGIDIPPESRIVQMFQESGTLLNVYSDR
jgi:hypothetical protein